MLVVIDTGLGNLLSVQRALAQVGANELCVSADPAVIARASRLVFPGQGAFGDCVAALDRDGGALRGALTESIARGVPYLGLCLGLQVLFERSEEAPGAPGLGLLPGVVVRFGEGRPDGAGGVCKVPHVGWNELRPTSAAQAEHVPAGWYYFVHSYFARPARREDVAGECEHAGVFAAAVRRDNLLAVQFHPEKSQAAGLLLLERWLRSGAAT